MSDTTKPNVTGEIDALKTVIAALENLDEPGRVRVLQYATNVYGPANSKNLAKAFKNAESPPDERKDKPAGPQEYLRRYNYKSMTKRIGVIAVFLERERAVNRFDFQAILKEFRDAKEPKLPVHVQFARAVQMNYLAKDGDSYYTTSAAETLVDKYRAGSEEENE
jgi:hypothetical protein